MLSETVEETTYELDFSELRQMCEEMYELNCSFEESREHAFLCDMMQCIVKGGLNTFADCLFWFNSQVEFDDLLLDWLEVIQECCVVKRGASAGVGNNNAKNKAVLVVCLYCYYDYIFSPAKIISLAAVRMTDAITLHSPLVQMSK